MKTEVITKNHIQKKFKTCSTFGDLISSLEEIKEKEGNVICGMRINGQEVSLDDEKSMALSGVDFIETIELKFENSRDLVFNTMNSLISFLQELRKQSKIVALSFREGHHKDGIQQFAQFIDSCEWANDSLFELRAAFHSQDIKVKSESLWISTSQTFAGVLKAMIGTFEVRDYVLLADLLEYELTEVIDYWVELLQGEFDHNKRKGLISDSSLG